MPKPSKPTSSFRVEGLESRILLSAAPVDGSVNPIEEPLVRDSVLILDAESAAETLGAESAESAAGAGIYDAATSLSAGEIFLSGEVAAGSVISAEVIHVADGTILEGVELTAG
jgi:hypothetical protein